MPIVPVRKIPGRAWPHSVTCARVIACVKKERKKGDILNINDLSKKCDISPSTILECFEEYEELGIEIDGGITSRSHDSRRVWEWDPPENNYVMDYTPGSVEPL